MPARGLPSAASTRPARLSGSPGSPGGAMRARGESTAGRPSNTASHPSQGRPTIGSRAAAPVVARMKTAAGRIRIGISGSDRFIATPGWNAGLRASCLFAKRSPQVRACTRLERFDEVRCAVDGIAFEERLQDRAPLAPEQPAGDGGVLLAHLAFVFREAPFIRAEDRQIDVDE